MRLNIIVSALLLTTVLCGKKYIGIVDGMTFQDLSRCDPDIIYRPNAFSVTGSAAYSIPAEQAILVIGLDVTKETAVEAIQESANIMALAIAGIQSVGVKDDEIATSNLSVQEKTEWQINPVTQVGEQKRLGYQVQQTLTITTVLVSQAGQVIDQAITNGMNRVDSVTFDAKPETKKAIKDSLISFAVDDSNKKADRALAAVGYHRVSVKSVSLNDYSIFDPSPSSYYMRWPSTGTDQSGVAADTQIVQATVTLSYVIEKDEIPPQP